MKQLAALTLALTACLAAPAEAIQFSSSSTTGQGGVIFPVGFETPAIGPVSLGLTARIVPSLSSFLGPGQVTPGLTEATSTLVDTNLNLFYHFPLADLQFLGRFNPTLAPYVGARYMGIPTSEASISNPGTAASYSQFGGINYGLRAYTELPLGFTAYAQAGLTTLTTGGWDVRRNGLSVTNAGKVAVAGTTLPTAGLGASWSLLNLITLSVGYETFMLPTSLRTQGTRLPDAKTTINSLNLGARILVFSF